MDTQIRTLYLADLDPLWDENYVIAMFGGYGINGLQQVKIIRDKTTGVAMGYGFIDFDCFDSAKRVLEIYQGREIPGYPGKVFRLNWGERKGTVPVAEHSLFVGDLATTVTDQALMDIFKSRFPSCASARIVTDHNTGASLGYGFVRFSSEEELRLAVETMTGHIVSGRTIRVARAQDRRNLLKPVTTPSSSITGPPVYTQAYSLNSTPVEPGDENNVTVFVGNLDPNVTEEMLTTSFAPFGMVVHTRIPSGKHIGFVTMASHEQAAAALNGMNGVTISTRPLRCAWGNKTTKPGAPTMTTTGTPTTSQTAGSTGGAAAAANMYYDPYYATQYDPYAMAQWQQQMWPTYAPVAYVAPTTAPVSSQTLASNSQPDFSRGFDPQNANVTYHRNRFAPIYEHSITRPPIASPFALG